MKVVMLIAAVVGIAGWYFGAAGGWFIAEVVWVGVILLSTMILAAFELPSWADIMVGLSFVGFVVYSLIGAVSAAVHLAG